MSEDITVIMQDGGRWRKFCDSVGTLTAYTIDDILPALARVQQAADDGLYAAGFVSYEAGPAFDSAVDAYTPDGFPLVWFGLFERCESYSFPSCDATSTTFDWTPSIDRREYDASFDRIKRYIADGDTYQVNYTFRLSGEPPRDSLAWFGCLAAGGRSRYGGYIDTGDGLVLCSFSPELFFERSGDAIRCRPMKGTAPRGLTTAGDHENAGWLASSEKNRAENLMIVDMIRNDLGRIAVTGSVHVTSLWDIERYSGVWQMTSTVEAETDAGLVDIFKALFPCASITGAPKARTSEIIRELESSPRRLYTGSIGFIEPDGRAQFNVAIRTAVFDYGRNQAEYGVGGGVVWDSDVGDEYDECIVKACTVTVPERVFSLLETILWTRAEGFFLLERHMERLSDSARYFGYSVDTGIITALLERRIAGIEYDRCKVRLTVDRAGAVDSELSPLTEEESDRPVSVAVDDVPVNISDPFLYHKTTVRGIYDDARARHPQTDDVLLINARGEVTESTIANVVVDIDGRLITPPVESGLLGGTLRAELLERGEITECVITVDDLSQCRTVYLINSVRMWRKAKIVMHNNESA